MNSMVDVVGLPDLGIGWEVTCDVLSMRIHTAPGLTSRLLV